MALITQAHTRQLVWHALPCFLCAIICAVLTVAATAAYVRFDNELFVLGGLFTLLITGLWLGIAWTGYGWEDGS